MSDWRETLRANLERFEERLRRCCERAGRSRSQVKLIAITKYVSEPVIEELLRLGQLALGESRPQVLWSRAAQFPQAEWHLVGHLQRNKVDRTLGLVHLIHSVDSVRLLHSIHESAQRQQLQAKVLLEVHLTDEPSKHGFTIDELTALPEQTGQLKHVHVLGFMTMAALGSRPSQARQTFARLRELRNRMHDRFSPDQPARELSMGMTNDFEEAVAEGATMIRIGSALFEGLPEIRS